MSEACPKGPYNHEMNKARHSSNLKSQYYYQKGFEKVENRQLSEAIPYLKKAIFYNKYDIKAKNVLGLVYFECGQIGEALKLWILSTAITKEDNPANGYIDKLHKHARQFSGYKESVLLYNRALLYLEKKNDDMAMIRLKKALQLNPNLVEAHNLLALCYLYQQQHIKAKEQLTQVLAIDKTNPKALAYLKYLLIADEDFEMQPKALVKAPRLNEQAQSYEGLTNKKLAINYRFGYSVLYFILGLLCMFAVQKVLLTPNQITTLEQALRVADNTNNELQVRYDTYLQESQVAYERLQHEADTLRDENEVLKQENTTLVQGSKLEAMAPLVAAREWVKAADILYSIAADQLDEVQQVTYANYQEEVYPKALINLYNEGYAAYERQDWIAASACFDKGILYGGADDVLGKMYFYSGLVEENTQNQTKARYYYEYILEHYPGTWMYNSATERLKTLKIENN